VRLGQFLDATATAKQFVTRSICGTQWYTCPSAIQYSYSSNTTDHTWGLDIPQSEYPLNVGKSAVFVVVPVTPKLTPEVLEDIDGGVVVNGLGIGELNPV